MDYVEVFYLSVKESLQSLKSARCYSERLTIFDRLFKATLPRKLEKGYVKGVNSCLARLTREYKKMRKRIDKEMKEELGDKIDVANN